MEKSKKFSWEKLLLRLKRRGLSEEKLKLVIVDGNQDSWQHLGPVFPLYLLALHGTQTKKYLQLLSQSYSGKLEADAKRIIYATSKKRHLRNSKPGKKDIRILLLKPLPVLRKILIVLSGLWTSDTKYGHLFVLLTSSRECSESSTGA